MSVQVAVDVIPLQAVGAYHVSIDWDAGPDSGLLCEVVDWVDRVRILDLNGEDVTVEQALAYFAARAMGGSPKEAFRIAVQQRASWWHRSREHRRRRKAPFYGPPEFAPPVPGSSPGGSNGTRHTPQPPDREGVLISLEVALAGRAQPVSWRCVR